MKKNLSKLSTSLILVIFLFLACTGCASTSRETEEPASADTADTLEPASVEISTSPVTMVEIFDENGTEIYSYMGTSKVTYRDGVKVIQIYTHLDQ